MDQELERLYETVSGYFALLAEPTRLKILAAICEHERSVGDIVAQVGCSQTNVSRHLGLMHAKGALTRRRAGALTFYAVADQQLVTLCRTVCVQVAGQDTGRVPARALRRFMAPRPEVR